MDEEADQKIKNLEVIIEDFRRHYDQISTQISHAVENLSVTKAGKVVKMEGWPKVLIKTKRKRQSSIESPVRMLSAAPERIRQSQK